MEKHTPGPWAIKDKSGRRVIKNARGFTVVVVENWTAQADARLIAASPDLLAALKEARECLIAADGGYGTYDVEIAKADAAIAKATGGV